MLKEIAAIDKNKDFISSIDGNLTTKAGKQGLSNEEADGLLTQLTNYIYKNHTGELPKIINHQSKNGNMEDFFGRITKDITNSDKYPVTLNSNYKYICNQIP